MTYISALTTILSDSNITLTDECRDALQRLNDQLTKRRNRPEADKTQVNERRKAATAAARAELVAKVAPIITQFMPTEVGAEMTVKEIAEAAKSALPEGFTAAKVQNVLLRELADKVIKIERKGKPMLYRLK